MRIESLLYRIIELIELNGVSMCLFNKWSWNGLLEHFLSNKIY